MPFGGGGGGGGKGGGSAAAASTRASAAAAAADDPAQLQRAMEELGRLLGFRVPGGNGSSSSGGGGGSGTADGPYALQQQQQQREQPAAALRTDVRGALRAASMCAARRGSLVPVPAWARMPSRLQRHWLRYAAAGAASAAAAAWLYRHSRLGGSGDLERWAREGADAAAASWRAHVVEPVAALRDELFRTFRDRAAIVSPDELGADKRALLRMLEDFSADRPAYAAAGAAEVAASAAPAAAPAAAAAAAAAPVPVQPPPAAAADAAAAATLPPPDRDAVARGMAAVMACYEAELRAPVRGLVAGDLARTLLIQVQRLKVDTEAAMLELDQILRSNELTVALLAAVPSLLVGGVVLMRLARLLLPRRAPDPKTEAVAARLAAVGLGRALLALRDAERAAAAAASGAGGSDGKGGKGGGSGKDEARGRRLAEAEGAAALATAHLYREAWRVFLLRDASSRLSEWPLIQVRVCGGGAGGGGKREGCVANKPKGVDLGGSGQGLVGHSSQLARRGWPASPHRSTTNTPCLFSCPLPQQADLLALAAPATPAEAKLELHRAMTAGYALLQA